MFLGGYGLEVWRRIEGWRALLWRCEIAELGGKSYVVCLMC